MDLRPVLKIHTTCFFSTMTIFLSRNILSVMSSHLDSHPDVGVVNCVMKIIDGDGVLAPVGSWIVSRRPVPDGLGYRLLDNDTEPDTPLSALCPTSRAERRPRFTAVLRMKQRRAVGTRRAHISCTKTKTLVLRCVLLAPVHFINKYLASYRLHANNSDLAAELGLASPLRRARWSERRFSLQAPKIEVLARRGIGCDRRVTGLMTLETACDAFRNRQPESALRNALRGLKKLITAPLASFGI